MKHFIVFSVLISLTFCACHSKSSVDNSTPKEDSSKVASVAVDPSVIIGSYVGNFGNNQITVLISKSTHDSIGGRSIVGVNDRPFNGTMIKDNGIFKMVAKEPGDVASDGVFNFTFDDDQPDLIKGSWAPNHPTEKLATKMFALQRRIFKYSADSGYYPEGSQRLLVDSDVNNLSKSELDDMRNDIFARHGYCFKNKDQRNFFERQSWYIPLSTDVRDSLTAIEKKNIALIKKFEKYAADYGDDFGR